MVDPDNPSAREGSGSVVHTDLAERNKELGFLHHAAGLLNMQGEPRDLLRAAVELLPSALSQPELASARLLVGSLELATRGYEPSEVRLDVEFDAGSGAKGLIEVCYRTNSAVTTPAFLPEERSLLVSLANLVQSYLARVRTMERLHQAEAMEQSAIAENRAKDQFLSSVSHELRSSLHVMLGWIQILQDGTTSPGRMQRGLEILKRNVTLQAKLIEDLTDLSRIISGKLHLESARVNLSELVAFAVDATRPAASAKQLRLLTELEPACHVRGDQQRLQQVVYNLLGNAVKFTPSGGRIQVSLGKHDARARLRVQDTGVGIDEQLLPHIFERFRQADGARKGRSSGLGLGLPIARHLVELHKGTIAVHSHRPEPGTTFEITLPLDAL